MMAGRKMKNLTFEDAQHRRHPFDGVVGGLLQLGRVGRIGYRSGPDNRNAVGDAVQKVLRLPVCVFPVPAQRPARRFQAVQAGEVVALQQVSPGVHGSG
jgi:hypothetical protein